MFCISQKNQHAVHKDKPSLNFRNCKTLAFYSDQLSQLQIVLPIHSILNHVLYYLQALTNTLMLFPSMSLLIIALSFKKFHHTITHKSLLNKLLSSLSRTVHIFSRNFSTIISTQSSATKTLLNKTQSILNNCLVSFTSNCPVLCHPPPPTFLKAASNFTSYYSDTSEITGQHIQ